MNEKEKLEIIKSTQEAVYEMVNIDIEDNPDSAIEQFQCDACGEDKQYAGSIMYKSHRLCNDCVLLAETGFALNQIKDIDDLIEKMEDKRLDNICEFIKTEQNAINN